MKEMPAAQAFLQCLLNRVAIARHATNGANGRHDDATDRFAARRAVGKKIFHRSARLAHARRKIASRRANQCK
jgi:hypothetical protein